MTQFVDLQVNGYAGVDFSVDEMTPDQFSEACAAMRRDGVEYFLPTLTTAPVERLVERVTRLLDFAQRDASAARMVAGLHIEGPFLNPTEGYRGTHREEWIVPASVEAAKQIVDAGQGMVKVFTLAPEMDEGAVVTRALAEEGIIVAAGHTDAGIDDLRACVDAGLSYFTHLGNGCRSEVLRHDNIIQRALSLYDRLTFSFIADGAHVPFFALGNYLRLAGLDRCVVVTDAMPAAGKGPGRYSIAGCDVEVGEDLVARAPGGRHLMGSAMSMSMAFRNLTESLGLTAEEAEALTSGNPRKLLGL